MEEKPWDERQWAEFMKQSDLRAARFGELLETLRDHPDQERILAHEMGWDGPDEDDGIERPWLDDIQLDPTDDELADVEEDDEESVEEIPAYQVAMSTAEKVHSALEPMLNKSADDVDERIGDAFVNAHIACAKLAAGHGMGYDDMVLCGNIVCCKLALEGVQRSRLALESLRQDKLLDGDLVESLLPSLSETAVAIESRIAELRSRVWW